MTPCPICGAATPASEWILPLAIQCSPPGTPRLALFLCHGSARLDLLLLRFGIIAPAPFTCRNTRWIPWEEMPFELRQRATTAEQLRLAMEGLI